LTNADHGFVRTINAASQRLQGETGLLAEFRVSPEGGSPQWRIPRCSLHRLCATAGSPSPEQRPPSAWWHLVDAVAPPRDGVHIFLTVLSARAGGRRCVAWPQRLYCLCAGGLLVIATRADVCMGKRSAIRLHPFRGAIFVAGLPHQLYGMPFTGTRYRFDIRTSPDLKLGEMGGQPRTGVPFSFQDLREYMPPKFCAAERLSPTDLDRRAMAGRP
jgi:hypothetical protein